MNHIIRTVTKHAPLPFFFKSLKREGLHASLPIDRYHAKDALQVVYLMRELYAQRDTQGFTVNRKTSTNNGFRFHEVSYVKDGQVHDTFNYTTKA